MRRGRLLMTLGVLCGFALACGGLEELADATSGGGDGYYVTAELTEPWASMGLPIDGGNVFVSTPDSVTFQYNAGALSDHFARYRQHFEGGGYEVFIEDLGTTLTVIYKKGSDQYVLTGIEVAGMATISVTDSGS